MTMKMSAPTESPDLLDHKMIPEWFNDPAIINEYALYEDDEDKQM